MNHWKWNIQIAGPLQFGNAFKITRRVKTNILFLLSFFKIHADQAFTGRIIKKWLEYHCNIIVNQAEIRKYIQIVRYYYNNIFQDPDHFLIATQKGYFITRDKKKIEAFLKKTSIRTQRGINIMNNIKDILKRGGNNESV